GASRKQLENFPLCHTASTTLALTSARFHTPRLFVVNTPIVDGARKQPPTANRLSKLRRPIPYFRRCSFADSFQRALHAARKRCLTSSIVMTTSFSTPMTAACRSLDGAHHVGVYRSKDPIDMTSASNNLMLRCLVRISRGLCML